METPTGENFAVYTRISTPGQEENTSVDQQLRECQSYGESQGWRFVEHLHDTKTGKAYRERAMINKLLSLVESKRIRHVVFYKVDRTAREINVFKKLIYDIYNRGGIVSIKGKTYKTAAECYTDSFLDVVFAEWEHTVINNRMQGGLKEQFNKGSVIKPLYLGYKSTDTVKDKSKFKYPAIDPEDSKTVRFMFDTYLETESMSQTLLLINESGRVSRRGNAFTFKTLKGILSAADSYAGIPEKQYFDAEKTISRMFEYPAIITTNEAARVKHLLATKTKQRVTSHGPKPFDRLVTCTCCGKTAQVYKHAATKGHHILYDGGYRIQCASFLNVIQKNYANKRNSSWDSISNPCRHQFKEGTFIKALEQYISSLDSVDVESKYNRDIAEMLNKLAETRDYIDDCEFRRDEIDKQREEFNKNMTTLMSVPGVDIAAFAKNSAEQLGKWETERNEIIDEYDNLKEEFDKGKRVLEYLGISDVNSALDDLGEIEDLNIPQGLEVSENLDPIGAAQSIFVSLRVPAVVRGMAAEMTERLRQLKTDLAAKDWKAVNAQMFKLGLRFSADFSEPDQTKRRRGVMVTVDFGSVVAPPKESILVTSFEGKVTNLHSEKATGNDWGAYLQFWWLRQVAQG